MEWITDEEWGLRLKRDRARRAAAYNRIKQAGICPQCRKAPAAPGKTRCAYCAAAQVAGQRERKKRRNAAGLCASCGRVLPDNYARKNCLDCLQKDRVWHIKAALKKEGIS